jgi:hypothetical protein
MHNDVAVMMFLVQCLEHDRLCGWTNCTDVPVPPVALRALAQPPLAPFDATAQQPPPAPFDAPARLPPSVVPLPLAALRALALMGQGRQWPMPVAVAQLDPRCRRASSP